MVQENHKNDHSCRVLGLLPRLYKCDNGPAIFRGSQKLLREALWCTKLIFFYPQKSLWRPWQSIPPFCYCNISTATGWINMTSSENIHVLQGMELTGWHIGVLVNVSTNIRWITKTVCTDNSCSPGDELSEFCWLLSFLECSLLINGSPLLFLPQNHKIGQLLRLMYLPNSNSTRV